MLAVAMSRTLDELEDTMSAHEMARWRVFAAHYPFGEEAAWLRSGVLTAAVRNQWRGKDDEPVRPADCMLKVPGRRRPKAQRLTNEESRAALKESAEREARRGKGGKGKGPRALNG